MNYIKNTKPKPSEQAQALALYVAWSQSQEEADLWEELPDAEQERWRRAARLIAVLGEGTEHA